jgi:glycosyltransferase involved in cell wall biosynthesis
MTPGPSFSVIVAAYQAAATIGEAIESALGQTLQPLEIVVCDDGSTDDLAAALAPYAGRVRVIRQDNRGEAAAKNAAARAARGDFVVILDADDVFLPERLERMAALALERPDLDIITTDAVLEIDDRPVRRCYEPSFPFPAEDQEREILRRNFVFGLAAVRRERLLEDGGFNESVRFTTDWERWIRMILSGSRVGLCDEVLARYRLRPGSLSAQRSRMLEGRLATLRLALGNPELDEGGREIVTETIRRFERDLLVTRARESLVSGDGDARRHALRAARAGSLPARMRVMAGLAAVAPGLARRSLARRPRETTAGIMVGPEA